MICEPNINCEKCARLVAFRKLNQIKFPSYHNAPVRSFGDLNARVLIVGLAPGLNGANQTNRPFTNDYAGDVLYPALKKFRFAKGEYQKRKDDGFELLDVRVTNAVRCVPPQNKVTTDEQKNCLEFLRAEIGQMKNLKIILSLGAVAHGAVLTALGYKKSAFKFAHGAVHHLAQNNILLLDSYHTSRYNINTGVLTEQMFDDVVKKMRTLL
ncbi:MAG: uracil-DNA glycosylase [Alphaproteobacteria bacterium]|nr:uracil-DNA glycosylase [Alphaproteobacteria bacterium]